MPELPDVAGFERYLQATALQRSIRKTSVTDERILQDLSPAGLGRRLKSKTLSDSRRHGKLLFAELGGDGYLAMHFGMTGELAVYRNAGDRPRHARVILELDDGAHLAYVSQRMLGLVGHTDDPDAFARAQGLGPDALDPKLKRSHFLQGLSGRRGALKPRLMDQSIVAGIGNIWADEILFHCRLHPASRIERLEAEQLGRLYGCMRRVLRQGADKGGAMDELPASYLLPHRQSDGRCPGCGGGLERIQVGGRSAWFCPRCQGDGA